ncbi:MAG: hypothetical protein CVU64_20955 [Deltaproteobacteria bacterium HGW-Deltaproteobacteria-21]|nr:MAG: hypothetical protein CVU64_20955 [Deltaproteobacteria bacterium HGW-Deltaproteobacteria-21]
MKVSVVFARQPWQECASQKKKYLKRKNPLEKQNPPQNKRILLASRSLNRHLPIMVKCFLEPFRPGWICCTGPAGTGAES